MKKCRTCKVEKEIECFYKHKQMRDGHLNICKVCKLKYAREQATKGTFNCIECGKESTTTQFREKNRISKFCSKHCLGRHNYKLGKGPPIHTGASCHNWKGDSVGYYALHDWVKRMRGNPKKCEHCNKEGELSGVKRKHWNIHWANKSHRYFRDIEDWIGLCRRCHYKYDGEGNEF